MGSTPRILVVCTANQCRSPMAEFLLRQAVEDNGINWRISSAGTHASAGLPMHPNTERLLVRRGIDVNGWTTSIVDDRLLDTSAVVLTATRQHSSYLIAARPALRTKIFPLRRFARLAASVREDRTRSAIAGDLAALLAVAGTAGVPGAAVEDDLADPIGHPYRRFKECARVIDDAIQEMLGVRPAGPALLARRP